MKVNIDYTVETNLEVVNCGGLIGICLENGSIDFIAFRCMLLFILNVEGLVMDYR